MLPGILTSNILLKEHMPDTPPNSNSLFDLIASIRSHVNAPWKQGHLMADKESFYRVCACMDVFQDTQDAINSYKRLKCDEKLDRYLFVYGLFQALFMQRDAVNDISKGLKITLNGFTEAIGPIVKIRNDLLHPTDRNHGQLFIQLEQCSLSKDFVRYMISAPAKKHDWKNVDIPELISDHEKAVDVALTTINRGLDDEYRAFKEKYMDRKWVDILEKGNSSHWIEKLTCEPEGLGKGAIRPLRDALDRYEKEVIERYAAQDTYFGIYEANEIRRMFTHLEEGQLDEEIKGFLRDHIACRWRSLLGMAKEMDKEMDDE
jgi:hypothetical protein